MKDPVLKRLLALLQYVAYERQPDAALFENMSGADWEAVFKRAVRERLTAVAFDGLSGLPQNLFPQRNLLLRWAAGADAVEQKSRKMLKVEGEVKKILSENSLPMLVIKGSTIAAFYKNPEHREYSDIDIYTADIERSTHLLTEAGAKEEYRSFVHSAMSFRGATVENHSHFVSAWLTDGRALIDNRLREIAFDENRRADFILLHYLAHAIAHFASGWQLRFFYDWAVLLHSLRGQWNKQDFEDIIERADFRKMADVFNSISTDYMKIPADEIPAFARDEKLIAFALRDMEKPINVGLSRAFNRFQKFWMQGTPGLFWKKGWHYFKHSVLKIKISDN
ncbi:MAG: nucleotidyltransferase family protein [Dysgonamonadaceae bacterium]|jgi:hypothetical protein|nr:nucleotidyltransferase family protein [Dysgonamonadaceae bacterium]